MSQINITKYQVRGNIISFLSNLVIFKNELTPLDITDITSPLIRYSLYITILQWTDYRHIFYSGSTC